MWTYPFKEAGSCDRWRGVEWLLKLLFVCLSACPHLVDLFPPRSSRRPSPFLLQDAHSSSVHRSVHLQTPAAASVVSRHHLAPVHLIPAQPHKKKKRKKKKGFTSRVHSSPKDYWRILHTSQKFSTWMNSSRKHRPQRCVVDQLNFHCT